MPLASEMDLGNTARGVRDLGRSVNLHVLGRGLGWLPHRFYAIVCTRTLGSLIVKVFVAVMVTDPAELRAYLRNKPGIRKTCSKEMCHYTATWKEY